MGLTEGAVSKWVNQRAEPDDLAQLVQICTTLHVSVDWLLDMPTATAPPAALRRVDQRVVRRLMKSLRDAGAAVAAIAAAVDDEKDEA